MGHVALEIPLRFLAFGGRGQRHHAAYPRVETLGDALDDPAFAGGIASLEQHHNLQALELDPFLQLDQFDLQPRQLLLVGLPLELLGLASLSFLDESG